MNIASYALKRLGGLLLVLFVTSFLVFGLLYLAPGSPLSFILGPRGGTPEQIAAVTEKYDSLIEGGLTPIARWGEPEDVAKAVARIDAHRRSRP